VRAHKKLLTDTRIRREDMQSASSFFVHRMRTMIDQLTVATTGGFDDVELQIPKSPNLQLVWQAWPSTPSESADPAVMRQAVFL
jgi:hypothetical protein